MRGDGDDGVWTVLGRGIEEAVVSFGVIGLGILGGWMYPGLYPQNKTASFFSFPY